jgi:hypothetical protein
LAQLEQQMANVSNNNSGGSSPKQPSQRYRCCIVAVAVLIAVAAAVGGICGTGRCSSPPPSPVPQPFVTSPVPSTMPTSHANTTISPTAPQPLPSTMPTANPNTPPIAHPNTTFSPKAVVPSPMPTPFPQPVPQPVSQPVPQPIPQPAPQPVPQPVPQLVPQQAPVPVSTMPTNTAHARADTILPYINSITLSGRTLTYPSSSSAEERAVQWLVEDDLGTAVDDEQSLRQRYILSTLWFFQPTPTRTGFGSANHAASWTSNIDECEWLDVECDANGHVTDLRLWHVYVQGQIPHDLGLLTDLTYLSLGSNLLSGTIPSSLGALLDLTYLSLGSNQLSGTIPSSLGALTALTSLFLEYNHLVGTMPFCNSVQSFEYLVTDCEEVNCTCCTECCPGAFGKVSFYCLKQISRTRTK